MDGGTKSKQTFRHLASYATDTDIQRLRDLKPLLISEWEEHNNIDLSDSEAVRRVIYELWKIKVAKL